MITATNHKRQTPTLAPATRRPDLSDWPVFVGRPSTTRHLEASIASMAAGCTGVAAVAVVWVAITLSTEDTSRLVGLLAGVISALLVVFSLWFSRQWMRMRAPQANEDDVPLSDQDALALARLVDKESVRDVLQQHLRTHGCLLYSNVDTLTRSIARAIIERARDTLTPDEQNLSVLQPGGHNGD